LYEFAIIKERIHDCCFVKVFWKARSKAKEELKQHLEEFRSKRMAGLGSIFGPSDSALDETLNDKTKEMKIVEGILVPRLEGLS